MYVVIVPFRCIPS